MNFIEIRNVSDKIIEKIRTHVAYSITPPFFENRAVYEIMWKNVVGGGGGGATDGNKLQRRKCAKVQTHAHNI